MHRTRALLLGDRNQAPSHQDIYRAICLDSSENLECDLVSIWRFDDQRAQIDCLCAFDALSESFSNGLVLKQADCPTYFKYIVEHNIVSAQDVRSNPITAELVAPYFDPHGIKSLLDFIIHNDFQPVGVICCENRNSIRHWSEADQNYLRSIATLTSFYLDFRS